MYEWGKNYMETVVKGQVKINESAK